VSGNLALYRKYRSATFAEVIGQDHVTEPLGHALANGRVNHAYLFSGPRGCGKTSSARILARSLNCAQGPTPTPCGECDSCRDLAPNGPGSIDVIEIDAASHGGVDDARDLRERAFFAPVRDRYKVYIIDEAHMVTTGGFNALLKLVEEPPDFLVFIFATTEPDKVLTTIRSRTHHYPFRLIPPNVLRAHVERICAAEGIAVEPAVLPLVVKAGGGSARDTLSILDQLLAGAGPAGVTYEAAIGLLGVTDATLLDDMVDALAAGDAAAVYGTVDRVVEAGHDPTRFAADLLDRFRDLILLDAVPDAFARGLIDAPADQAAHMVEQASRLGGATVTRYAEIVHTALLEMRGTTSPRLVLELLCARMQLPDVATDSAAILQRLERLERRNSVMAEAAAPAPAAVEPTAPKPQPAASAPKPSAPKPSSPEPSSPAATAPAANAPAPARPAWPEAPASMRSAESRDKPEAKDKPAVSTPSATRAQPSAPAPQPESAPLPESEPQPTSAPDATALRRLWPEVLNVVKENSKRTHALLLSAQVSAAAGETVTLAAPPALAKMLAEPSNADVLSAALTQVIGGRWKVIVEAGDVPAPKSAAGSDPSAPRAAQRVEALPEPEVDPRDDPEFDEDAPTPAATELDPETQAIRLLQDQLGARPMQD
jgi:DNA polymerase-3 subunit gamma/tau